MRVLARCLLASLLLAATVAASAEGRGGLGAPAPPDPKPWRLSVGAFMPLDDLCDTETDIGFSVGIGRVIHTSDDGAQWLVSVYYSRYGLSDSGNVSLISPLVEYRKHFGTDKTWYGGVGIGLTWAHRDTDCDATSFAYTVALGKEMPHFFVEVRFLGGTEKGENGVMLGGGIKF